MPAPRVLNRRNTNEYGLTIPSRRSENYEPELNNTAPLLNLTNPDGFNYRKNALAKRNAAWANYKSRRNAKAAAAIKKPPVKRKNNNTQKALDFEGGKRRVRRTRKSRV